jgi:Zn-dependent protease with chaperone function
MKKEYKYFGVILSIFIFSVVAIFYLLKKYSTLTFQHFVETCQQIVPTFFTSGVHFIGLALVVLTALIAIVFCAKTLFSLVKTQRKISSLLKYKLDVIPNKLLKILKKLNLQKNRVVVIDRNTSHAFNYGLKSRRIVLSNGLIDRLSPNELEAVVLHEQYHLESKHSLLLILSEIVSSTVFFLPLVKEINNRMKVVFEKQADAFTESVQGSNLNLNMALIKVPNSRIQFYPSFSMRRQHEISRNSVYGSVLAVFIAVSLFLFPINIHANDTIQELRGSECTQTECTTHCPTDNMSKEQLMSSNLQHNLSFIPF